jgi:hypothetical protein
MNQKTREIQLSMPDGTWPPFIVNKFFSRSSTDCLHYPESLPESSDETVYFNSIDLPTVQEQAPSPVSSIHVDMHDYDDDDDDGGGGDDGGTET